MLTNDLDTYMNHKYIEYFIYNLNLDDEVYKNNYDRVQILSIINDYIVYNRNLIDENIANHIRDVVLTFRDIEDDEELERKKIIQDIIINLNIPFDVETNYNYYRTQLYTRTKDKRFFKDSKEAIDVDKSEINVSIAFDFALLSFLVDVKDDIFMEHLPELQNNEFVYLSLHAVLCEFPLIINNERFVKRLNKVLVGNENKKENKKLVKEIKKIKRKF